MATYDFQVTFDAHHPASLAEFWAVALGYTLQPPPPGYDSWDVFAVEIGIPEDQRENISAIVDPEEKRPRVLFLKVPEGKTAKNRVHLDVNAAADHRDDPEAAEAAVDAHVETLIAAGATYVDKRSEFGGS